MDNGKDHAKFNLSVFEEAELTWLRRKVDELSDEQFKPDARPDIKRELWQSREELEVFVSEMRKRGRKI